MEHETWSGKLDYILTLTGYCVGVAAIWKFPYMCARNGGGSFLIPYIVLTIVNSVPMTYMEMLVGQISQGGPVTTWEMCPPLRGVGFGSVLISWFFSTYFPAIFAWALYYLYNSFSSELPWTLCNQTWNTPYCVNDENMRNNLSILNETTLQGNQSVKYRSSADEFYRFNVLQISDGLSDVGSLRPPLVVCSMITFVCVYLFMIKGVKLSGKIVYLTVACPYILVTVFLVRACLLEGAYDGIMFYITPHFDRLLAPQVWIEACSFSLYVMGISYGFIITMSGKNPVNNNCFRDSVIMNIICTISQVYCGFAVFAITGHVAYKQGVTLDSFQSSGFKLAFLTYPEAASYLPVPQLWSAMLFIMLSTLAIDSLAPSYEVVIGMIGVWIPRIAKRRWLLNACIIIPSLFISLIYVTEGGVYALTLVEWYAFFPSLALFAFLECVMVTWIYGTDRMRKILIVTTGRTMPKFAIFMIKYLCPLLLLVIFSYSLYAYRPPVFEDYVFPPWATVIGWMISMSVIAPTPVFFIWSVYKAKGNTLREKLREAFRPRGKWNMISNADAGLDMNKTDEDML